MKGGVAMMLSAFLRVAAEQPRAGGDLILALTSDEETGSEFGAKYLVEEHADHFDGVRYALSEFGGFTQWTGGRPLYPIQVAEKQRCLVRATIRGTGGHPSTVVGGTAAGKVGRVLRTLEKRRLPVHVTPRGSLDARRNGGRAAVARATRPAADPRSRRSPTACSTSSGRTARRSIRCSTTWRRRRSSAAGTARTSSPPR